MEKPVTTLFMLSSLDWKISTWTWSSLDIDKDFPKIKWVNEWLYQYYALEQKTDLFSLNSGKTLKKIWMNKKQVLAQTKVSFIVIDSKPYLTKTWVVNMLTKSKKLYIVTTNKNHPAYQYLWEPNLEIIEYEKEINFENLFKKLKSIYKIKKLTIQTWGTLNSIFLRKGLIDNISIIVAPVLIWWEKTPTLIGGETIKTIEDLVYLKALKLINIDKLKHSYIHLKYKVINSNNEDF